MSSRFKKKTSFDPNYSNKKGQSYLHFFAFDGNLSGISVLSEAGADLNKQDRYGLTPLHYAALMVNETQSSNSLMLVQERTLRTMKAIVRPT
jgi:ankyrin repeat protein